MAALDYLDFDLEVEASGTPGSYQVSVLSSPRGEASGQMTFPFNPDALENVILKLGRTRSGVRALGSPTQQVAKQFGSTLYDALFAGEVGTCFRRSLDEADAQGKGLRIRLRLNRAPQLADVPWEYLYPSSLRQFLVLSTKTPVVRYLEQPRAVPPLTVTPPLQVLVVVCSPTNLATLDVDAEVARIGHALAGLEQSGQVRVTVLPHASLADLRGTLRRLPVHVLHFIGHGGFDDHSGDGMLAFEDDHRLAHLVSGSALATIIHDQDKLRLVLLNACEGARQSPADPFGGVAQSLVAQGVPAVVAMQFEITDEAATVFSAEFYSAIADGYPIDAALAEARVAVFSDDNDVEWGTPVLYLRASDGRIFDVANQGTPSNAPHPSDQPVAASESAGARVIPVVVPPWPSGPGDGWGGGAEMGSPPAGPPPAVAPTTQLPPRDRPPSGGTPAGGPPVESPPSGPKWAIIAAVAAVLAVAVFFGWPYLFPGGVPRVTESPTPTVPVSPTPTVPTPSPTATRRTTSPLPPLRAVPPLKALRGSVTIDGRTDDWQWQLVSYANNQIAGKSDAKGDIYLMWDDEALYLLALVTDPGHYPPDASQPTQIYKGDSVLMELGPDKSRLEADDLARPTDAFYMFGLPASPGTATQRAILGPDGKRASFEIPKDASTLTAAIALTPTGYVLEAKIPWRTTGLNGIKAGVVLAGNVSVSERGPKGFGNLGVRSTNPQRVLNVRARPAYWQALELQP
ncbi:MAG: CHAT domain-containing protein [Micropruina sp.]|uniref:CHAT domain-containing protein n=1 Tax=Micropruina sp. TaxID=2737536 RepID=UPI0039E44B9C